MSEKNSPSKKPSEAELDRRTVQQLAEAILRAQTNWHRMMARSFVGGLMTALGATLGFALFVLVLGYVLKWLGVVPGLSTISQAISDFVSRSLGQ